MWAGPWPVLPRYLRPLRGPAQTCPQLYHLSRGPATESATSGAPSKPPCTCHLEVYKLLLETIVAELARGNAIRSNMHKWHVHHALLPYGPTHVYPPPSFYRGPIGPKGAPLPDAWRIAPSCADGAHGSLYRNVSIRIPLRPQIAVSEFI